MSDDRTTARKWASMPLMFEKMRKKHDRKKLLRFRINHRTMQALALEKRATTDADRELAKQFWREVEDLKQELKEVEQ